MPNPAGLIRKLDAVLSKANVSQRTVYKRVVTRAGGDDFLGRPGTVTYEDTLLVPTPSYQRLGRNIVGNNAPAEEVLSSGTGASLVADDYAVLLSPSSIALAELENPDLLIVFKDTDGTEESFFITDYEPQAYQGVDITFTAYIRSKTRPQK